MESNILVQNAGSKEVVKLVNSPVFGEKFSEFYVVKMALTGQVRHKSVVEHLINSGMYIPQGD